MKSNAGYCSQTLYIGSWRCVLLQRGHRLGRVKRLRSLNTYPHARQEEGRIITFFLWAVAERAMWGRCSYTSFSRIPIAWERSLALISFSLKRAIICWRVVFILWGIYISHIFVTRMSFSSVSRSKDRDLVFSVTYLQGNLAPSASPPLYRAGACGFPHRYVTKR